MCDEEIWSRPVLVKRRLHYPLWQQLLRRRHAQLLDVPKRSSVKGFHIHLYQKITRDGMCALLKNAGYKTV